MSAVEGERTLNAPPHKYPVEGGPLSQDNLLGEESSKLLSHHKKFLPRLSSRVLWNNLSLAREALEISVKHWVDSAEVVLLLFD